MNVLVVNCGSSSLKFQLINYDNRDVLAKGLCERIGIDGRLVYEPKNGEKEVTEAAMPTHVEAIQMVLDALVNEKSGVIKSLEEVDAIGHRVLHGGMKITNSVIIDDEVIKVADSPDITASDAAYIVAACNAVPMLVEMIEYLAGRLCDENHGDNDFDGKIQDAFEMTEPKE